MTFPNVDAYIFSWGNYLESAKLLQSELSQIIKNVYVIHSGEPDGNDQESTIYVSENYFFGDQFKKCSELLDNTFLFHMQADTKILDLNKLKDFIEKSISLMWEYPLQICLELVGTRIPFHLFLKFKI